MSSIPREQEEIAIKWLKPFMNAADEATARQALESYAKECIEEEKLDPEDRPSSKVVEIAKMILAEQLRDFGYENMSDLPEPQRSAFKAFAGGAHNG